MEEKDRALLKNFIDGCSYHNLEILFWPESFWEKECREHPTNQNCFIYCD